MIHARDDYAHIQDPSGKFPLTSLSSLSGPKTWLPRAHCGPGLNSIVFSAAILR